MPLNRRSFLGRVLGAVAAPFAAPFLPKKAASKTYGPLPTHLAYKDWMAMDAILIRASRYHLRAWAGLCNLNTVPIQYGPPLSEGFKHVSVPNSTSIGSASVIPGKPVG